MSCTGKILEINLSRGETNIVEPPEEIYKKFLGGRGLAGYFFRKHYSANLSMADSPLLIFSGPLVGTAAVGESMLTIMGLSPLNNRLCTFNVFSNAALELKQAGFDGLVINGISGNSASIEINNQLVKITPDSNLSDKPFNLLKELLPSDGSNITTGNGAHKGILFSNLIFDGKSAGNSGLGYNLKLKNINNINISGTGDISINNFADFKTFNEDIERLSNASPALRGEPGFSNYGTAALYDLLQSRRMTGGLNFKQSFFPEGESLNIWHLKNTHGMAPLSENFHPEKSFKTSDNLPMPDFKELVSLTAMIGNHSSEILLEALTLIHLHGIDALEVSNLYAFLRENSIIDNISIVDFIKNLLSDNDSPYREGTAAYVDSNDIDLSLSSMTMDGIALPPVDPRGAYGYSLSLCTSSTGPSLESAMTLTHEILRKPVATDRFSFFLKPRIIKANEDSCAALDSLGISKYMLLAASAEEYVKVLNSATGDNFTVVDILKAGERAFYNEIYINRELLPLNGDSKDRKIPERFFKEKGSEGDGIKIPPLDYKELKLALEKYNKIRGLDEKNKPLKEKLNYLGLL